MRLFRFALFCVRTGCLPFRASADAGALNRSNARAGELGHARRFFSLPLKVSEAVPARGPVRRSRGPRSILCAPWVKNHKISGSFTCGGGRGGGGGRFERLVLIGPVCTDGAQWAPLGTERQQSISMNGIEENEADTELSMGTPTTGAVSLNSKPDTYICMYVCVYACMYVRRTYVLRV